MEWVCVGSIGWGGSGRRVLGAGPEWGVLVGRMSGEYHGGLPEWGSDVGAPAATVPAAVLLMIRAPLTESAALVGR